MTTEFFEPGYCSEPNPLTRDGKYINGVAHATRSYGGFDSEDPVCTRYCSTLPWLQHSEPLAGSQDVAANILGGHLLTGPHFWTQFAPMLPGKYVFQVEIDGVASKAMAMNFPLIVSRLTIVRQPQVRKGVHWRDAKMRPGDLLEVTPQVRAEALRFNHGCLAAALEVRAAQGEELTAESFKQETQCKEWRDGTGGYPMRMAWVNDDMTPAPAIADLTITPLTRQETSPDEPFVQSISTFGTSSPVAGMLGRLPTAEFPMATIVGARSGCYRAVFYVPNAQPFEEQDDVVEAVFAGRRVYVDDGSDAMMTPVDPSRPARWIPTLSDPVCVFSEEQLDKVEKPSSVASPGTTIPEAPAIRRTSPRDTSSAAIGAVDVHPHSMCYEWKRGLLREMDVGFNKLVVDSVQTNRKAEPALVSNWASGFNAIFETRARRLGSTPKRDVEGIEQSMRQGDVMLGSLLSSIKVARAVCRMYLGFNVDSTDCELPSNPQFLGGNYLSMNGASGGFLLYDIDDGRIKFVSANNCEFFPYMTNAILPNFYTGDSTYGANPWGRYMKQCNIEVDDWADYAPGANATWEITAAHPWISAGINASSGSMWLYRFFDGSALPSSVVPNRASLTGTQWPLTGFSADLKTINWLSSNYTGRVKLNLEDGAGQFDLVQRMIDLFDACALDNPLSANPGLLERELTEKAFPQGLGILLAIGRATSRHDEKLAKSNTQTVRYKSMELQNALNGEVINLRAYDALVSANPQAPNLRSQRYDFESAVETCLGSAGAGTGLFGDCCESPADCSADLLCHPVQKACTQQCTAAPLTPQLRAFFQTTPEECDEEPLTQRRNCEMLKPSYASILLAEPNINARLRFGSTSATDLHLCSARKSVGSSFAAYCTACRNMTAAFYEKDPASTNPHRLYSVLLGPLPEMEGAWSGDVSMPTADDEAQNSFAASAEAGVGSVNATSTAEWVASLTGSSYLGSAAHSAATGAASAAVGAGAALDAGVATATGLGNQLLDMTLGSANKRVSSEVAYCSNNPDNCMAPGVGPALTSFTERLDPLCATVGLLPVSAELDALCQQGASDYVLDLAVDAINGLDESTLANPVSAAASALTSVMQNVLYSGTDAMRRFTGGDTALDPITVSLKPATVSFVTVPPAAIKLGEPFLVSVHVSVTGGAPLVGFKTILEITDITKSSLSPDDSVAQTSGTPSRKDSITYTSPAIETGRNVAFTASDGIARFTVVVSVSVSCTTRTRRI